MSVKESLNTQEARQVESLEQGIYHLEFLLLPEPESKRKKIRKSPIKILYAQHLAQKHCNKKGWEEQHFSRKNLGKMASSGVSVRSVASFINDEKFKFFGSKWDRWGENGRQKTNGYKMHDWVHELFNAFERCGMMKKFRTDFDEWLKTFKARLHSRFLPLLQKGLTLWEVVKVMIGKRLTVNRKGAVNKLSSRSDSKLHGGQSLNCTLQQTPSESFSYHASKEGSKDNTVQGKSLFFQRWEEMERILAKNYKLMTTEISNLMRFSSLVDLDRGLKLRKSMWIEKNPRSEAAAIRYCIKRAKEQTKNK